VCRAFRVGLYRDAGTTYAGNQGTPDEATSKFAGHDLYNDEVLLHDASSAAQDPDVRLMAGRIEPRGMRALATERLWFQDRLSSQGVAGSSSEILDISARRARMAWLKRVAAGGP
jgi:hypothetical protein